MVPLAVSLGALIQKYPGTGGIYLWTREDYGPWHGFLAFFVYWIGIALLFPSAAMFYASLSAYMLGPSYAHLADSRIFMVGLPLTVIWVALGTNLVGIRVGKWTENCGAIAAWILGVILAVIGLLTWLKRGPATVMDIRPVWNWDTVNQWATIAYAMSGLELAGFMSSEIRNPRRDFPRAAWIASGFILVFYVFSTASMLAILRPERISEINGLGQVVLEFTAQAGTPWLLPLVAAMTLVIAVGVFGGIGTSVSRLPLAAGTDKLLPSAFAKIHPRWHTPYVSILIFGGVATFLLVAIQAGETVRAAYQTLVSLTVLIGFLPYIYIFGSAWKAGCRVSAVCGTGITILAVVCSVIPSPEISNVWLFEGKIALGTVGIVAAAWLLYRRSAKA